MAVTNQALTGGYQLLNYRIDRQISRGGFSIVYRAFDETGAPVAIKEYLPSSLVLRTEGDIVRASSAENLTSFRYGMKCFFEEGRALAKINHPNVVRVLNFFRANETVYMVMRYERGRTLQQQIQMRQDQMSERLVRHVFMHLLNGLREVHTHKLLHLDIKPANIYLRTEGTEIRVDEENQAVFRHGLKCFFEEGRALAMISHPNVVRVENFFRANETCYMVMQYVRGRTLQFHIQRNRHEFTEGFIRKLFAHLMNGLREVHARKLLHLDIKPANVFLAMEGRPVLLDFGAARITLSEEAMKLKPMYTAGFAAPEHYRFQPGELGPWSDIYSVGATMYTCIAGTPPQAGDAREEKDRMIPLKTLARQQYSDELYKIIDDCLAIDHLKRPQTAFDLQKRLIEAPSEEAKRGFLDTLNAPLSKLFQR